MWLIFLFIHCCLAVAIPEEHDGPALPELRELPEEELPHPKMENVEPEKIWETGFSDQYKSENTLGEYSFGYNEDHTSGGSFRRETSDRLGNKIGSYGLRIGDGRVRVVNYVADQNGFRADVLSNEPGIAPKKNIYTVLVPGFRYSSGAPYVSFDQGQPLSNLYDRMSGNTEQQQYEEEGETSEGEELGEVIYTSQGDQDEEGGNVFTNEEGNFGNIYTDGKHELGNVYIQESQMPEEVFMEGEYSHESETVLLNQTSHEQTELKEGDVSSSTESGFKDSTSTVVALLKDNLQKGLQLSQETYQEGVAVGDDLHPSQSNNVLSQSNEQVIPAEQDNTTWNDSMVTESTEVED